METCVQCEGPLMILGTLGCLTHARCRDCGWEQTVTDFEEENEDDD